MARSRVEINRRTIQQYLDGEHGVESQLEQQAEAVANEVRSTATVLTGNYRDNVRVETDHTDRMVKRVVADVPYAMKVEADDGTLARALDSAG